MKHNRKVFVVSAVRTPIGSFGGALKNLTAVDLGVAAVGAALDRAGIAADQVDEVIMGMARQAGTGPNPARQVSVRAGIGVQIPAYTVNKACGSGLKSIMLAYNEIVLGNAGTIVAGGMESMSRVPYLIDGARWGLRMGHQELTDGMYRDGFFCPLADMLMGETAERLAETHMISREEQDAYALESQRRAAYASETGRFADEIVPIRAPSSKGTPLAVERDEHIRHDASLAKMARLRPVFRTDGTITAANSSGITDGAAAAILVSEDKVEKDGLRPLCRIVDYAVAGVDPKSMGIGPVPAVRRLLSRTGMRLDGFGLVELNEAFAAQVLACQRELDIDPDRLNVNGGAIALGHPIGCTGTRILTTLVHEMHRRDVRHGLATLCVSGGMGIALAVERV